MLNRHDFKIACTKDGLCALGNGDCDQVEMARRLDQEQCLAAVEQEEEFDGEMPDDLFEIINKACNNRAELDKIFRAVVKLTKRNIKARIERAE